MQIPRRGVLVFDSGIGGLTVLAACKRLLPRVSFYYYGDNDNAPYGNLSSHCIETLSNRVLQDFAFLAPSAVVLACNTVTAVCVEKFRLRYDFPIVGAEPAVFSAAKQGGEILVLCTRATANSQRLLSLCRRAEACYPSSRCRIEPCDALAGEIEKRLGKGGDYEKFLPKARPSAVVLGCTHYVYIKEFIAAYYRCPVFDGNDGIARRLKTVLAETEFSSNCLSAGRNFEKIEKARPLVTPTYSILQTGANKGENAPIFFLGNAKTQNMGIYEQMFAK